MTRIALIHATPVAMAPVRDAFSRLWSAAETFDLLDSSLSGDRAKSVDLTPQLDRRIGALARYALEIGADGVLFTCSAFGEAIERAADELPVPVLKPNEAMFRQALNVGGRVGMIATFAPAVAGMEAEFHEEAARVGQTAELKTYVVPEAMEALRDGREQDHNDLVATAAASITDCAALMLAHFSTSRAAETVGNTASTTVLTSPDAAVIKMQSLMAES